MNINLASLTQFKYGRLNAVDLNNKRYRMYDCPLSYFTVIIHLLLLDFNLLSVGTCKLSTFTQVQFSGTST